jgi:hypothetical protein
MTRKSERKERFPDVSFFRRRCVAKKSLASMHGWFWQTFHHTHMYSASIVIRRMRYLNKNAENMPVC